MELDSKADLTAVPASHVLPTRGRTALACFYNYRLRGNQWLSAVTIALP